MLPEEYISWNGLCAYQAEYYIAPPVEYANDKDPPKVEIVERPIYRR
ncbi:MAG: hypothetical protein ACFFDH_12790 [Promethearchaeota archaeon]